MGDGSCAWEGEGGGTGPLGIDYVRAYHCGFGERGWLFYPVLLGWGCFITYLMGHTADAYFSPTLATLSDKLKLTYDVAGVTFLALGNGAPDVFSSIAAFSSEDPQVVLIGVCELLGASVFVTTVVVGAVVLLHPASVRPQAFARDILFQVLANLLLTASALYGRVTAGLAVAYLALYALYVIVVLYLDRAQRRAAHGHGGTLAAAMQEADGGLGLGDGASGVMSAFWFSPSDVAEFHRAMETASVHKLTHDFLLLDDDELSSESDSDAEIEGGGGPSSGLEAARRRNSSVDQARHPFTHSLISEYFPDEGLGPRGSHHAGGSPLTPATTTGSVSSAGGGGSTAAIDGRALLLHPSIPNSSSSSAAPAASTGDSSSGSSPRPARAFAPFNTAGPGPAGAEAAYRVSSAGATSLSDDLTAKGMTPLQVFSPPSNGNGGGAHAPGPSQQPPQPSGGGGGGGGRRRHASVWDNMYWHQWRLRRALLREFHASAFLHKPWHKKIFALLELPLILARNVTVPLVEEEAWSRLNASLCPLFAPLFLLAASGNLSTPVPGTARHLPLWLPLELAGAALAVAVRLTTHESRPPAAFPYAMALAAAGFVMCAAWIYSIATELVAVVTALGKLWALPSSLLGLTLLAWGNSAGDLITNIAVARAGLSDMAIAGCFAGPTFNLLVGLGASFLWKVARTGQAFDLQFDQRAYISLSFLYLALMANLGIGYASRFQLGRGLALPLLGLYAACTLLQLLLIGLGLSSPDG